MYNSILHEFFEAVLDIMPLYALFSLSVTLAKQILTRTITYLAWPELFIAYFMI